MRFFHIVVWVGAAARFDQNWVPDSDLPGVCWELLRDYREGRLEVRPASTESGRAKLVGSSGSAPFAA